MGKVIKLLIARGESAEARLEKKRGAAGEG
jgi:hypothetical protein